MNILFWVLMIIAIVIGLLIGTVCVAIHKIDKLYDELENINPENWDEKE